MYHIKNDKRAYKSAASITESLFTVLEEKPFQEITIAEVCAPTGIARTTFYRLFDTLDDVLLYQMDQILEEGISEYLDAEGDERPYALFFFETAMKHPTLVKAVVESGRYDLFRFAAREKNDSFLKVLRFTMKGSRLNYCMSMLNAIGYATLRTWVENDCKESPEEVYEMMKQNLKTVSIYL